MTAPTLSGSHYTTLRSAIYHAHDVAEATGQTVFVATDPDNPARYVVRPDRPTDPTALVCAVNPPPF